MNRRLNLKKALITAIVLNTIQIVSAIGIIIYYAYQRSKLYNEYIPISVIILVIIINIFITVRNTNTLNRYDRNQDSLEDSLEKLEHLNITLRAQRHDFLNHLQVVYGLMEMEEYKEAREYIERVYSDIQKVSQVLKTSTPAINALLQAKMLDSENRGIVLKIDVSSRMENLPMPAWEFCRVLGNLIDNSMFALQDKISDKFIEVNLSEDLNFYTVCVKNSGPEIPREIQEKIFETGFTTKGTKGEGMGLSIVKELIGQYNGSIRLESNCQATSFDCRMPKTKV